MNHRVAIISGGGSGIGRAACELFAAEGAQVIVADLNLHNAEKTAETIVEAGGTAVAHAVDVADEDSVRALIDDTVREFGRLDILVNNAGYGFEGTVLDTDLAAWERIMAVNVRGVFLGSKYAIPQMIRQGSGVIVNTASTGAIVGIANRAAYCTTKGAVASLTKSMAVDHASENIRINAICPGTIDSPYHDDIAARSGDPENFRQTIAQRQIIGRLGRPEEIASAMLFLASDDSSFATGSLLTVDGGMTAA
ncbi:SDR family oxidoreductase [Pseudarthrobacter sp. NCCP-2145]|uniref:SDR family oxidoreductase n=1 Tax=Pseudarthrobacter sp. NCCP-2145 TaxID=2942290 RepID=UPI0020408D78|nr:SDR family oxidoreductase [Pseudarthrobacter sp. NCCP-2145]